MTERCHYCDRPADVYDHVVPRCRGGTNEPWNLVPACVACNYAKLDRPYRAFVFGEPRDDFGPSPSRLTAILRWRKGKQHLEARLARVKEMIG